MAIIAKVLTEHGENKDLYLRVNDVQVSNHNVHSKALVRGFISREAFNEGFSFIHEEHVHFKSDVSNPIWEQVYDELKLKYPDAIDVIE